MANNYFLSPGLKKSLKFIHHFLSVCTLGGSICVLALLLAKESIIPVSYSKTIDYTIFFILDKIICYAFLLLILSGIFISLLTNWGFVKHYWLIFKQIISVILLLHVVFWLIPAVNGLAANSDSAIIETRYYKELINLAIFNATISSSLFFSVILLSVVKPFGIRKPKKIINRQRLIFSVTSVCVIIIAVLIITSFQLNSLRAIKIKELSVKSLVDGKYSGIIEGGGSTFEADVKIESGKFSEISLSTSYSNIYTKYAKLIINKIKKANSLQVDVVSGATTTSKLYLKAIEQALIKKENL